MPQECVDVNIFLDPNTTDTTPAFVRGGIKIVVGGNRVNSFCDGEDPDYWFSWEPEFIGELVLYDVENLLEGCIEFARVNRYKDIQLQIPIEKRALFFTLTSRNHRTITISMDIVSDAETPVPCSASIEGYTATTTGFFYSVLFEVKKLHKKLKKLFSEDYSQTRRLEGLSSELKNEIR